MNKSEDRNIIEDMDSFMNGKDIDFRIESDNNPDILAIKTDQDYLLETSMDNEPIVTIAPDGTVTVHKEGGDKEAARAFYECLQFEGRTLFQKIKDLEDEIISLKEDKK
ncbi:MAG: hypothetical protein M0P69_01595 [Bacteroidales bacterium]|nr:hypothetical protein [Bacteroidales bacterium]